MLVAGAWVSIKRWDARRDANEQEIVDYLSSKQIPWWRLDGPLDLLLLVGRLFVLWEVKVPKKGRLTELQTEFLDVTQHAPRYVVKSVIEAQAALQDAKNYEMQWTLRGG